ncbi:DUF1304 domain-containing protein [Corynebacterium parakroppenstedtii]|uniref:DUF1304 domain-containing protein n=2 Tax=Corynebacterium parakroppenstedtii TaxID=2828363 RepID=UPI001C8DF101|nr:DUF1304 domain-containing protein [Corynebacterium parakroppenstedtii]MBY0788288.1 DUF1304 domain-containing protein [Corynebacterium parakroppenstedtii]
MIFLGAVVAALAALLHVFIFYLESVAWTGSRARSVFGMSEDEAVSTKELAFNQGFYNLFLALEVFVALGFLVAGATAVGGALALAGVGSMLAAALVLWVWSPDKRSAAVKQGSLPLLAVILITIGLCM